MCYVWMKMSLLGNGFVFWAAGIRKDIKGRQGNFCSITSVLSDDYKKGFNKGIKTQSEYEAAAMMAQDSVEWKT